jgi:hypothetical protein
MKSDARWRGLGRTFLPFFLALPLGYLAPFQLFAGGQAPREVAPQKQMRHQRNRPSIDDRVSRFAKSLDLSEAQQSAVKKILEQQQQETWRIRLDPSITGAGVDRFRALQENTVERIRAVLNEEQKKKYDPLAWRRLPPTPQQPSVEDWLKTTTPR